MRSKYQNKKAQVAIFMVIGLMIIVGGAIFFYATRETRQISEPKTQIIREQIPTEFDPVRSYVDECVYSTSVEGLRIIGKQGGYISLTNKTLSKESFSINQNPTESDAVSFTRDSELKIPYWWYLKSSNNCNGNCEFASKRPDLRQTENSIEKQLERYVDAELADCINNFEPFRSQGYIVTEKGKIKSDVAIASNDVAVLVEYPIEVQSQNSKTSISQFGATIPVNLEKVYELATKITNLEMKHNYLEKHVLNLIVSFSGISKEKLPPMSDLQFKFGSSVSWQKSEIKNRITGLLSTYIQLFQVDGTYNYDRNLFESDLKQSLYDSTILPVANSSFENIGAYFTYLDFWPVYFDMNCKGERCVPSSANSLLSFFWIQDYDFDYDISYPVLVEVKDPFALNGEGYTFNFFLEGNIRNNRQIEGNFTQLEMLALSERTQLCDIRTSGRVTVNVLDSATKLPVKDAQVLYTLAGESCFIGSTNEDGLVVEQFPVGVGGVVNLIKENYIGKAVEFDPRIEADDSFDAEIHQILAKNIVVKKKNVVKNPQGWQFADSAADLTDKEQAVVSLTRYGDENELEFSSFASYEGLQPSQSQIEIAPGRYFADMTLVQNERIVIPEEERCVSKGVVLDLFTGKECYTVPKIDFGEGATPGEEKFPEGGLKLNFTVTSEDLQKDTLVVYAVAIALSDVPEAERKVEDIDQLSKLEEYSTNYSVNLQPAFE
ncbi:hypothetical protein HY637_01340 [Candidatus Woesearchaeota archaeon]|nr:hypothetical protein [Candidatus Woesearchaeota archaeon]